MAESVRPADSLRSLVRRPRILRALRRLDRLIAIGEQRVVEGNAVTVLGGGRAAFQAVEETKAGWRERLPEARAEWFSWLVGLPQGELLDLLGLCAALTVNALPSVSAARDAAPIAQAVGLDMADWWEPTADGFLNHVSKAQEHVALVCV